GASRRVRGLQIPQRDWTGCVRHPLSAGSDGGGDGSVDPESEFLAAGGKPLGESGLRTQDPRLEGSEGSTGEHGRGGPAPPGRRRNDRAIRRIRSLTADPPSNPISNPMHIRDLLAPSGPKFSFEYFPPKSFAAE